MASNLNPNQETKFRGKYRAGSMRFSDYDYSSDGAYFVTICTKDKKYVLGEIQDRKLVENEQAQICWECWLDLPNHYANCILDEFVIMPNHLHGVVFIDNGENYGCNGNGVETGLKPVSTTMFKRYPLSEIIRGFKTFSARKINQYQKTEGQSFWQKNYYERIIRNEDELFRIREYIVNNPLQWEEDKNNPENLCF